MAKNKYHFMLGKLFGSNTRVRILKLFVLHPKEKFYIRQIARDVNLQLNSVRRELENLEQFGLLVSNPAKTEEEIDASEADGKTDRKYYQVNTNFVLYDEIKSLLVKAQFLYERDFVDKLKKVGQARLLILTGFFVNKEKSLVDILLVGRFNKEKLTKLIRSLENELGREVNYAVMDNKEFKYRKDITDIFLYDILENKKIVAIDEMGVVN
jgi:hypothetical protein